MKKTQDTKADDIEFLLKKFPNLRVAYIDSPRDPRDLTISHFSVLVKYDDGSDCMSGGEDQFSRPGTPNDSHNKATATTTTTAPFRRLQEKSKIKEVYRVKLPGNPIIGM